MQLLTNEQIKGAGLDFGVTGAKVRRAGDVGGKGAVVSRKAANAFTGGKGVRSKNQQLKKKKKQQPESAATGVEGQVGAGEFFEVNGPGAPKRAKMGLPLSAACQLLAKAKQERLDQKKKANKRAASDRKNTDRKRNKKNKVGGK